MAQIQAVLVCDRVFQALQGQLTASLAGSSSRGTQYHGDVLSFEAGWGGLRQCGITRHDWCTPDHGLRYLTQIVLDWCIVGAGKSAKTPPLHSVPTTDNFDVVIVCGA